MATTGSPARVDAIVIGGLRQDTLITPDGRVYRGQIGGNAAFAAAGARVWGVRPGMCARVGDNYPPQWWDSFAAAGIDTAGVCRVPGAHDMRTFYAYLSAEERDDRMPARHFARLGQPFPPELEGYDTSTSGQEDIAQWAPLAVRPEDLPSEYAAAPAAHVAPAHILTQASLPGALRAHGVPLVTLDPSERLMLPGQEDTLARVLSQVDAFLPSAMEVRALRPDIDLWAAAEWFATMGPAVVVIKIGAQGQYVYDRARGRRWHVPPSPPQPLVDVTGAGDAYCGGFLIGLLQTGDALEAALRGTVSSALAIGGVGALYALDAPQAEIERRLSALRGILPA